MTTKRQSVLRGSVRALTGLAVTVVGGVLFLNLGATQIEPMTTEVPAFTVDTTHTARHIAVCQGAFQVLGTDPSKPDESAPVGNATLLANVEDDAISTIGAGRTFAREGQGIAAGAQSQRIDEEVVSGRVAQACGSPRNESWIAAGSTARGLSGTIILTNPGDVPATVRVTVHDETGELGDASSTGILVPAQTQRTLSLNGFGAGRLSPVIHVQATGAPVVASLALSELRDIVPTGATLTNAQDAPTDTLVFPGVVNFVDHSHHDDESDAPDEFPAFVRLLFPPGSTAGSDFANASVQAVMPDGTRVALAEKLLESGTVADVQIDHLPDDAMAVIVDADVPIVGGFFSSLHNNNDHDFTWMTPSTVFEPRDVADVVVLPGGQLTAVNLGDAEVTFTIERDDAEPAEVTVPGAAAARLEAGRGARISADGPFALGVTITNNRELATYPVLGAPMTLGKLTVYTR